METRVGPFKFLPSMFLVRYCDCKIDFKRCDGDYRKE